MGYWLRAITVSLILYEHANAQADLLVRAMSSIGNAKGDATSRPVPPVPGPVPSVTKVYSKRIGRNRADYFRYQSIPQYFGGFSNP